MEETTFAADPMRLMIAAAVGIVVLLVLIIKFKLHPVLSMMISAIIIGAGAGMPLTMISDTVEKGVGKTLQGIALLVGLGSMFGGILEVSGGAQKIAEFFCLLCNAEYQRDQYHNTSFKKYGGTNYKSCKSKCPSGFLLTEFTNQSLRYSLGTSTYFQNSTKHGTQSYQKCDSLQCLSNTFFYRV